jgi:hypothetical protein
MRQRLRDSFVQSNGLCQFANQSRLDDRGPCRDSLGIDRTFSRRSQSAAGYHPAEPTIGEHDRNKRVPVRAERRIADDGNIDVFGRLLKARSGGDLTALRRRAAADR